VLVGVRSWLCPAENPRDARKQMNRLPFEKSKLGPVDFSNTDKKRLQLSIYDFINSFISEIVL
jgi:hypothetical protein